MYGSRLERAALGFLLVTLYVGVFWLLRRYWDYLRKANAAKPAGPARWTLALVDNQTGVKHTLDIDSGTDMCGCGSSLRSQIEDEVSEGAYLSSSGARKRIMFKTQVLTKYTLEDGEVEVGELEKLKLVPSGVSSVTTRGSAGPEGPEEAPDGVDVRIGGGQQLTKTPKLELDIKETLASQVQKIVSSVVSGNSGLEYDIKSKLNSLSLAVVELKPGESTRFRSPSTKRWAKAICCGKIVPSNKKLDFTTEFYTKGANGNERRALKTMCLEKCGKKAKARPGKGLPRTVTSLSLFLGSILLLLTFGAFWSETTPVGGWGSRSSDGCSITSTSASGFCNIQKIKDEGLDVAGMARARTNYDAAERQAIAAAEMDRIIEVDVERYMCLNSTSDELVPVSRTICCLRRFDRGYQLRMIACTSGGVPGVVRGAAAGADQPGPARRAVLALDRD